MRIIVARTHHIKLQLEPLRVTDEAERSASHAFMPDAVGGGSACCPASKQNLSSTSLQHALWKISAGRLLFEVEQGKISKAVSRVLMHAKYWAKRQRTHFTTCFVFALFHPYLSRIDARSRRLIAWPIMKVVGLRVDKRWAIVWVVKSTRVMFLTAEN